MAVTKLKDLSKTEQDELVRSAVRRSSLKEVLEFLRPLAEAISEKCWGGGYDEKSFESAVGKAIWCWRKNESEKKGYKFATYAAWFVREFLRGKEGQLASYQGRKEEKEGKKEDG